MEHMGWWKYWQVMLYNRKVLNHFLPSSGNAVYWTISLQGFDSDVLPIVRDYINKQEHILRNLGFCCHTVIPYAETTWGKRTLSMWYIFIYTHYILCMQKLTVSIHSQYNCMYVLKTVVTYVKTNLKWFTGRLLDF